MLIVEEYEHDPGQATALFTFKATDANSPLKFGTVVPDPPP